MPLPESHLESLERLLRIHNEQIVALRESLKAITHEIGRREKASSRRVGGKGRNSTAKVGGIPVLNSQREAIEREIGTHEALIALGRDRRNLDILGELLGSPDLAREAAHDPRAFAEDRGIEIPANMALELDVHKDRLSLRMEHYDEIVPFVLMWNSVDGFGVPSLDPQ